MKSRSGKFEKAIATSVLSLVVVILGSNVALASDITPENVIYLINSKRTYYGLEPLKIDQSLDSAAQAKTTDMINRDYFEHYAFGLTPWDFMKKANYNYLYAGENLAMNFQTSEGMVNAWMNSPLHRANILNPDYNEMGLGIVKGAYTENNKTQETIIVDNMFGRQKPVILDFFDNFIAKVTAIFKF
ncbi:MAG TPA: CAP domain-containing protein [Patescibacteria group bacterium]|nr:CAP domain-containing protein [Patescibacteria group bacterium]